MLLEWVRSRKCRGHILDHNPGGYFFSMLKRLFPIVLLVCASLLVSFILIEGSLRFFYPKYADAARSHYNRDSIRTWAPLANYRDSTRHPDTGIQHNVFYNALALRQSRNFDVFDGGINIGFFGDSFTINHKLPVQYSFTEPLDFLLNTGNARANVLNFGVNGYGTTQSYLNYLVFEHRAQLDYVFYVLCSNDLRNIYETNLFSLDEDGQLKRNPVPHPNWWISVVSRLHMTYLLIDSWQRLLYSQSNGVDQYREQFESVAAYEKAKERINSKRSNKLERDLFYGQTTDDTQETLQIFARVLEKWRQDVESHGGKFFIVLLPKGEEEYLKPQLADEFTVISLHDRFSARIPGFSWDQISFKNDGHWAESGNLLASIELFRLLEESLGWQPMPEADLRAALTMYYTAFDGWLPEWMDTAPPTKSSPDSIRDKYLALELERSSQ